VQLYDTAPTLIDSLIRDGADVVYIAIHGKGGEEGSLQTLLELAGLPFAGSSSSGCRLAWDKTTARALLKQQGFFVPRSVALPHSTFEELGAGPVLSLLLDAMPLPLVLKPNSGGSVLGIRRADTLEDVAAALVECFAFDDTVIIEEFVDGIDVTVAVVERDGEPVALDPLAIGYAEADRFDYGARHASDRLAIRTPEGLGPEVTESLKEAAVRAHRVLGLRDYSRSDFIVRPDGTWVLLEVALSPGLDETAAFPIALGEGFGREMSRILTTAAARKA
jgi:D-alanine-D-alanine ligase